MSTTKARRYITTQEVASHLSCSEETIRRLARDRRIPYLKVRSGYRFDLEQVIERLEKHENPA